jgi:hypothetical protein
VHSSVIGRGVADDQHLLLLGSGLLALAVAVALIPWD